MTHLLDSNLLIALTMAEHVHHGAARRWVQNGSGGLASCPITQGALVRTMLRTGSSAADVGRALAVITGNPRHVFWPDGLSFTQVRLTGVLGHRQVTDAYLAQLTRHHDARLATFDKGLVALRSDVADLVPTT